MILLAGVVAALSGAAVGQASIYAGHHMMVVTVSTPEQLEALDGLALNLACRPGLGAQQVIVPPQNLAAVAALNLPSITVSENAQAVIEAEAREIDRARQDRDAAFFTTYRNLTEMSDLVDDLVAMAPAVATRFSVGTSIQSRDIFGIKITGPGGGPKPKVVINGCQHAREWISPMSVCWAAEQLALGYGVDSQITAILDRVEVHIIPVVNPDGFEHTQILDRYWRKNRRANGNGTWGVDLNRNWAYQFGGSGSSGSTSSETYRGTAPFSEPESAALSSYINSLAGSVTCIGDCAAGNRCSDVRGHLDIHTAAALVLGPWGYSISVAPPREQILRTVQTEMKDAIVAEEGYPYQAGLGTDNLLYEAAGIAPDWTFAEFGALAWTYELRPNTGGLSAFSPPASEIAPAARETFAGILALLERIAHPSTTIDSIIAPSVVPVGGSAEVSATTVFDECAGAPTGTLHWRFAGAGAFTPIAMSASGDVYAADLPAGPCASELEYYMEFAIPGVAEIARVPETPGTYLTAVSFETTTVFTDSFQTNTGWGVTNSGSLTDGQWTRGVPVLPPSTGAPSADADGSGQCYLTDNALGNSDVDGGSTTLTSPILDASDPDAYIEYARWFHNTGGASPASDTMLIEVSSNNGGTWVPLETVGPGGPDNSGGWVWRSFKVSDIPSITNTSQFRIRFIAQDTGAGSVVEAAVDAVSVVVYACSPVPCAGDVNGDGFTNASDFTILAGNFGASVPVNTGGDLNGDGFVNASDFTILAGDFGCTP